jgi:hypothetical protein
MGRRNKEQHVQCEYEKEILDKIGNNKTNEKTFNDGIFIAEPTPNQLLGFYTYRGQVCILDGLGMDVSFSEYNEETKKIIHSNIVNNNYN